VIWDAIERSATLGAITSALNAAAHNGVNVGAQVGSFVEELRHEGLIVPAESSAPADGSTGAIEAGGIGGVPDPFDPPVLEKYTDMQHLILLDPVHEVDEREGWPRPRDDA
jgi:hypothetical protein